MEQFQSSLLFVAAKSSAATGSGPRLQFRL